MSFFTDVTGNMILAAIFNGSAFTATTAPVKLRLTSTNPTATAAGTEVAGGSYLAQTVTFTAPSGQALASNVTLTYTNMPAVTVKGGDFFDAVPTRKAWGLFPGTGIACNSGDTFTVTSGTGITATFN